MGPAKGSRSIWGTSRRLLGTQAWNSKQEDRMSNIDVEVTYMTVKMKEIDDFPGKRMKKSKVL